MAPVNMWIDKFGGEVVIDADHPLAVAQRERDAAKAGGSSGELTATHSDDASAAAATVAPVPDAEPAPPSSLEAVAAKLTAMSDDDIAALAKEAGLDAEASRDSLVQDLAILIDGGLMSLEGPE